jgi:hypothetical protein
MPVIAPAIVINDVQSAHAVIRETIATINNGRRIIYNRSWSIGNWWRSINRRWLVLPLRLSLRLLTLLLNGLYHYVDPPVQLAACFRAVVGNWT